MPNVAAAVMPAVPKVTAGCEAPPTAVAKLNVGPSELAAGALPKLKVGPSVLGRLAEFPLSGLLRLVPPPAPPKLAGRSASHQA